MEVKDSVATLIMLKSMLHSSSSRKHLGLCVKENMVQVASGLRSTLLVPASEKGHNFAMTPKSLLLRVAIPLRLYSTHQLCSWFSARCYSFGSELHHIPHTSTKSCRWLSGMSSWRWIYAVASYDNMYWWCSSSGIEIAYRDVAVLVAVSRFIARVHKNRRT